MSTTHRVGKPRILLVDDDRMIRTMLAIGMRQAGYEILQAGSAEEALQVVRDDEPDLAVLDVSMPGMSGMELARALHESSDIPFLFLSSHTDSDIVQQAAKTGAIGYLVKPLEVSHMIPSIEAGLARASEIRTLRDCGAKLAVSLIEELSHQRQKQIRQRQLEHELEECRSALSQQQDLTRRQLRRHANLAAVGRQATSVASEINDPVGYMHLNMSALQGYLDELAQMLDVYSAMEEALPVDHPARLRIEQCKRECRLAFLRSDMPALVSESIEGILRIGKLAHDLTELARAEGMRGGEWEWSDLHAGLDSALRLASDKIGRRAELVREYGKLPLVECQPAQLNQVFLNLVMNAAQSIPHDRHGLITVSTGANANQVWVAVTDNGRGMLPDEQRRMFDPFFMRGDTEDELGLGLAITEDIVRRHGGRIYIASTPDEGTQCRVLLPRRRFRVL